MSFAPDTTLVRNPERTKALALLRAHEKTVTELERQIGQLTTTASDNDTDAAQILAGLREQLDTGPRERHSSPLRAETRSREASREHDQPRRPARHPTREPPRAANRLEAVGLQRRA